MHASSYSPLHSASEVYFKYNRNVANFTTNTANNCNKFYIVGNYHNNKEEWKVPQPAYKRQQGDEKKRYKMCPIARQGSPQGKQHES